MNSEADKIFIDVSSQLLTRDQSFNNLLAVKYLCILSPCPIEDVKSQFSYFLALHSHGPQDTSSKPPGNVKSVNYGRSRLCCAVQSGLVSVSFMLIIIHFKCGSECSSLEYIITDGE